MRKIKQVVFIIASIMVFAIFNYSIYQKEQIKNDGDSVLLELSPADPRSIMQGDYMRLRYAIEGDATLWIMEQHSDRKQDLKSNDAVDSNADVINKPQVKSNVYKFTKNSGCSVVILPNQNKVAKFIRIYNGEKLGTGERLLSCNQGGRGISIIPESFMFQEGDGHAYQNAKYGVFKFGSLSSDYMLVGLADAERNIIELRNDLS